MYKSFFFIDRVEELVIVTKQFCSFFKPSPFLLRPNHPKTSRCAALFCCFAPSRRRPRPLAPLGVARGLAKRGFVPVVCSACFLFLLKKLVACRFDNNDDETKKTRQSRAANVRVPFSFLSTHPLSQGRKKSSLDPRGRLREKRAGGRELGRSFFFV